MFKKTIILIICAAAINLQGCSLLNRDITITSAKTATKVDDKLLPVSVADTFPKGTAAVSCWFQWKNAKVNTQITAKWHYVTDDVHILDYNFNIPKKEGMGSVMLSMPEGKTLPSGYYKVSLYTGKSHLKSLNFTIE